LILNSKNLVLKQFQELMGRLNDVGQMCPFLQGFKSNLNDVLSKLHNLPNVKLTHESKNELFVWANFINDCTEWQHIAEPYNGIPIAHKVFSSDAAGCADSSQCEGKIGCGNVGFSYDGIVIFAYQLFWPDEILRLARDEKLCRVGNKTTTLEFLGIVLPFLIVPRELRSQHILVKVDNIGCYFGWLNKQVPGDKMASILVRALHLISSYLECRIHIDHLPRNSSWDAQLVDRLSRDKSTTKKDRDLLRSFDLPRVPETLLEWMRDPTEDWGLPMRLLEYVQAICEI